MVKIRLRRVGSKKKPSYRLVVADARASRGGAFIDIIGHYNPLTDPETVIIAEDKARHWLEKGAQPTNTAARLLAKVGIIEEPEARKEKIKTDITAEPRTRKKKAKAGARENPQASVTEEPETSGEPTETSKEEPQASVTEESETSGEPTETSKEEPQASVTEESETSGEPTETSKEET